MKYVMPSFDDQPVGASTSVDRLTAGIAHDINNFLTIIQCYSSSCMRDIGPSDPLRAGMEEIQRAGQRAAELTRQLLDYSYDDQSRPRVLDLHKALEGLRSFLPHLLGPSIQLRIDLQPEHAAVFADPRRLEQVVLNLALNARDAIHWGTALSNRMTVF